MARSEWFMAAEGSILCVTYCEPSTAHQVQVGRQTYTQLYSSLQLDFCSSTEMRLGRSHRASLDGVAGTGPAEREGRANGTECAKSWSYEISRVARVRDGLKGMEVMRLESIRGLLNSSL